MNPTHLVRGITLSAEERAKAYPPDPRALPDPSALPVWRFTLERVSEECDVYIEAATLEEAEAIAQENADDWGHEFDWYESRFEAWPMGREPVPRPLPRQNPVWVGGIKGEWK